MVLHHVKPSWQALPERGDVKPSPQALQGGNIQPSHKALQEWGPSGPKPFCWAKITCFDLSLSILILLGNILSTIGADRQNLRHLDIWAYQSLSCAEVATLLQQCRSLSHLDWCAQEFHSQFSICLTCQFIATHCQNKILWTVSICFIHFMGMFKLGMKQGLQGSN